MRTVRKHRCLRGSQHEKETGVLNNATRIRTSECLGDSCNEWVQNWAELGGMGGKHGHLADRNAVPTDTFSQLLALRRPASRRHNPREEVTVVGGLRNPSRTCSGHEPVCDPGAKMRTVFEGVFLEPPFEESGKRTLLVFPPPVRDKIYDSLYSSSVHEFTEI